MPNGPLDAAAMRGRAIIDAEAEGLRRLAESLDGAVDRAVSLILRRGGRLIVTGVGKSGLIGAKLAATFASTGTPSFFLHAAEAAHGDLGMITGDDTVLAVSYSGNTRELAPVLDFCRAGEIPVIAVTSGAKSRLAQGAAVLLRLPDVPEVCPNNLAPTTSATITLVLGHVLAVLLMERRAFADTAFAQFHPGGRLGLLLSTVRRYLDEFDDALPRVLPEQPISEVIAAVADGRKGCVVVCEGDGRLAGIITEGDLRRAYGPDMFGKTARGIMTANPVTVAPTALVREAVALMKDRRISNVIVVEEGCPLSVLDLKDIMQRGYV